MTEQHENVSPTEAATQQELLAASRELAPLRNETRQTIGAMTVPLYGHLRSLTLEGGHTSHDTHGQSGWPNSTIRFANGLLQTYISKVHPNLLPWTAQEWFRTPQEVAERAGPIKVGEKGAIEDVAMIAVMRGIGRCHGHNATGMWCGHPRITLPGFQAGIEISLANIGRPRIESATGKPKLITAGMNANGSVFWDDPVEGIASTSPRRTIGELRCGLRASMGRSMRYPNGSALGLSPESGYQTVAELQQDHVRSSRNALEVVRAMSGCVQLISRQHRRPVADLDGPVRRLRAVEEAWAVRDREQWPEQATARNLSSDYRYHSYLFDIHERAVTGLPPDQETPRPYGSNSLDHYLEAVTTQLVYNALEGLG